MGRVTEWTEKPQSLTSEGANGCPFQSVHLCWPQHSSMQARDHRRALRPGLWAGRQGSLAVSFIGEGGEFPEAELDHHYCL